jgi:uncharacterized damage-inducible protein DinB
MSQTLGQALSAHFDSVFTGPNGDYPAVLEALAGLTMEDAAWKPASDCNSIWQIVDHLTDSKRWQVDMLEKGQAASPAWTRPERGTSAWQASLTRLEAAHARLKRTLGKLPEDVLFDVPAGESRTRLELLLSIAAHEAYHGGQIDYLKGLVRSTKTNRGEQK